MLQKILLLFIPLSAALEYLLHASPILVFAAAILGIIPLAMAIRDSTEDVAEIAGPSIGGLLNVTFGNAPELILALFILAAGGVVVVKGQITGSIIGNGLLGLGIAIVVGAWKRPRQSFSRETAGQLSTLLILVVIGLIVPALFDYTEAHTTGSGNIKALDEYMSLGVSLVLIALYIANLIYTLFTRRDTFEQAKEGPHNLARKAQDRSANQTAWKPVAILLVATAFTALEAELVSGALESTAKQLGLSTFFVGIIILALVGNVAEYVSAIYFAGQDEMSLVMPITVGSSIQMGLLVAPLLVIVSYLIGKPMDLVFSDPLELIAIAGVAFIVSAIAKDGQTTWFEGVLLIGVYIILAIAFFYITPG